MNTDGSEINDAVPTNCQEKDRYVSPRASIYEVVGRPAYVHVDLDAITNNVSVLRSCAKNPHIGVIGLVKANAYGHGAVAVALHLKSIGVERLAVATTEEGIQLREAGVKGPLHIMGNMQPWETGVCLKYKLVGTVATAEAVLSLAEALKNQETKGSNANAKYDDLKLGTVHLKVDTGMSRNGCQPEDVSHLVQLCSKLNVPLEGIFTHFADFEDKEFTERQLDTYYAAIKPYRGTELLFHTANSGGTLAGAGTELDFIRPGIALYGLPPGSDLELFQKLGFRPAAALYGQASMTKPLPMGRKIGYGCVYTTTSEEWIVTIPVGYGDGYWRHLSNSGTIIRERTGESCPIVGRVSMDAITARVQSLPPPTVGESFCLLSADFHPASSVTAVATALGTISYEVTTRFQSRLPRYYTASEKEPFVDIMTMS